MEEDILDDLIEMKEKLNDIIEKIILIKNFKEEKCKQSEKNNFGCTITLFENNKKDHNKNVNKTLVEIKEYYNKYISTIDTEFKEKDKVNINKIRKYVEEELLQEATKYKENIRIEGKEGKYKNTSSNKRNYTNKIARSVILYNNYNDRLNKIYFSLNNMSRIYNKNWEKWLLYLEKFMDKQYVLKDQFL
jgi:hypothetical protein